MTIVEKEKLRYEKQNEPQITQEEINAAKKEQEEIYKKFKPYKDLFELEQWKKIIELMKDDAFNNLHHTEDGVWYHRSWGIKMFINCIAERSQAYDNACKELSK